jgi:hypothetical protein
VCLLSYRRLMVIPLPTMALYFMSDMEIIFAEGKPERRTNKVSTRFKTASPDQQRLTLSIFLIPSQCRTSGISSWWRMSLTPAMFSVRAKYCVALSPPRLRAL